MIKKKKDLFKSYTENQIKMSDHLICDRCKIDLGKYSYVSQYKYCPYCGKYLKGFSFKEWFLSCIKNRDE